MVQPTNFTDPPMGDDMERCMRCGLELGEHEWNRQFDDAVAYCPNATDKYGDPVEFKRDDRTPSEGRAEARGDDRI